MLSCISLFLSFFFFFTLEEEREFVAPQALMKPGCVLLDNSLFFFLLCPFVFLFYFIFFYVKNIPRRTGDRDNGGGERRR